MNVVFRFVALLILLSMEADAIIFQQRVPRPRSIERNLQRDENESDPAATDFLAKVAAATLKDDSKTEDFSNFAAFVDALVARASSSNDLPFSSNWTSTVDLEINAARGEDASFEDVGSEFTPSPEFNSMRGDTDASISVDQVIGSISSASGDQEDPIGADANMAEGANVSNNLTVSQLPYFIIMLIIAFALEMAN